jgi:hypothetical protein
MARSAMLQPSFQSKVKTDSDLGQVHNLSPTSTFSHFLLAIARARSSGSCLSAAKGTLCDGIRDPAKVR